VRSRISRPDLAAALSVVIVALCLLAPVVFLGHRIVQEASQGVSALQEMAKSGELETTVQQSPQLSGAIAWFRGNFDVREELKTVAHDLQQRVTVWLQASVWAVVQLLIALFVLFFLFRDRDYFLQSLRQMVPLSDSETDKTVEQVRGMIHATIYGNAVVAIVQGTLGGLMFWFLGIPGALLWAAVMAIFSLVPNMGAFVVWLPAAILMAAQGDWMKAAILAGWGVLAVGSIDNVLYPTLVGKEMRMHTVPVFIATVGGLLIFGSVGLVLGPVTFTLAHALLDVLRRRTTGEHVVEEAS
jgi:predicted PurR-regulated permease PerM